MKNLIRLFIIIFLTLFLTSCVDYVQSISYKDGKYHLYYKMTLSKALFELGDNEPEDLFDDFNEGVIKKLPKKLMYNSVDTELETGAEFFLDIDPKSKNKSELDLLPKVSGNKCFIPFLLGNNDAILDSFSTDDSDGQAFTDAVLSSAKCRVLIGKNLIPLIETAYFEAVRGGNYSIPVYDYGDSYCLEISFIVLLQKGMYRADRIIVIKK